MKNIFPERKEIRLNEYDYSTPGSYFVTVCASERRNIFWNEESVGASIARPRDIVLSSYGKSLDDAVNKISNIYPMVRIDHYVIMPDHFHILLTIRANVDGRAMLAPTVGKIVQQLKGYVTKQIGFSIWQKSFFDHIIRNSQDYDEHVKYIYENPMRWNYKNN